MSATPNPLQNHLLAALSSDVLERLLPHLELVGMPLGMVIYESGDTLGNTDLFARPCPSGGLLLR